MFDTALDCLANRSDDRPYARLLQHTLRSNEVRR